MTVRDAARKSGAVAGAQDLLALVGDERDLARDDIDELVLAGVPVPLARRRAGRKLQQVDAEMGAAARIAQPLAHAILGDRVERRGISGARALVNGLHVDLRHLRPPSWRRTIE